MHRGEGDNHNIDVVETVINVYKETDKAVLHNEEPPKWLPKTLIDVQKVQGIKWTVQMPRWLARKHQLDFIEVSRED